jgi:hypothetical protein
VGLEAGVSQAAARAAVKAGHLDPERLGPEDIVALKVAVMLAAFRPAGELRPANEVRQSPRRDTEAISALRDRLKVATNESALVVTANRASFARTFLDLTSEISELAKKQLPYLVIPVGGWVADLAELQRRAA